MTADAQTIRKRIVLHFPGFEPLDPSAHHARYVRTARQSAAVWGLNVAVGPLVMAAPVPFFDITTTIRDPNPADNRQPPVQTRFYVFDHKSLVTCLTGKPMHRRLAAGYASAARVIAEGGLLGYFRHAWRFGLFFLFPFLLVALACLVSLALALAPVGLGLPWWNLVWSLPAAMALFRSVFLPQAERLHTMHLFADWELAVAVASLDRPEVERWLEHATEAAGHILAEARDAAYDEILVTSHSMGSNMATHVIGALLERQPDLLHGRRLVFVTLGGAILQCALLRPAARLRARIGLIARASGLVWLEVQCLTDSIHFYKTRVVAVAGHADAPQAGIVTIRLKQILSAERYRRIKLDFLRVHRQYVLAPDRRASFDFTLMTAGPLPAAGFAAFSPTNLPVLSQGTGGAAQDATAM